MYKCVNAHTTLVHKLPRARALSQQGTRAYARARTQSQPSVTQPTRIK